MLEKSLTSTCLISTTDAAFGALCGHLLTSHPVWQLVAVVDRSQTLGVARQHADSTVILDIDGLDEKEVIALGTRLSLVSPARLILVSGYLGPGSEELDRILMTVDADFVQKPQGSSSLSLSGPDGERFVAAWGTRASKHA